MRSDMTTIGSVTLKVRKNAGAATTYTSGTTPAIVALADASNAFAIEIPASTYADGDRVEGVWLYAGVVVATWTEVIGPAAVSGADYTTARAAKLDNLDATTSSRASQTSLDTVAGYVDTEVAAIKAKTDNLPAAPAATSDIPSAATIAAAVWGALLTGITTAGSIGKLIKDNIDAAISSRLATSGYSAAPSAATISAAVVDQTLSGHTTTGTVGGALNAAGGAADPLTNAVPGSYAAGTAGYILGHVIPGQDASIASPLALDLELTLVKGDDYNASDSRNIDFNEPNASWPTLTGATVKFGYQEIVNGVLTGNPTELAMSVITGTGSSKVVRLELSAAQSDVFATGRKRYEFDVQATLATSGRKVTLARGFVTVLPSFVA